MKVSGPFEGRRPRYILELSPVDLDGLLHGSPAEGYTGNGDHPPRGNVCFQLHPSPTGDSFAFLPRPTGDGYVARVGTGAPLAHDCVSAEEIASHEQAAARRLVSDLARAKVPMVNGGSVVGYVTVRVNQRQYASVTLLRSSYFRETN